MTAALRPSDRPGIARCSVPTWDQYSTVRAKRVFRDRIAALWPELSQRRRAHKLGINEATLRGYLNEKALDRLPSQKLLEKLDRHEQFARLSAEFGALG